MSKMPKKTVANSKFYIVFEIFPNKCGFKLIAVLLQILMLHLVYNFSFTTVEISNR